MASKDDYARTIIAVGRRLGIRPEGIVIGLAVPFVECEYRMLANPKVPNSLNYAHEGLGTDGKSVGLYQQQVILGDNGKWWWGDAAACMDPTRSAEMFFERLKGWRYWEDDVTPGWYAQQVQASAYPDRYDHRMSEAQELYDRLSGAPAVPPSGGSVMGDPVWLADVLRAEGLEVVEYPGWKDRGHGDFGGIWGIVAHHTGGNPPSDNPGAIANHPTLGLASQVHLNRAGKFTVVGAGIAWHAGQGRWPGIQTDNANAVTIGIEAENNGTEGWSAIQYDAYMRGCAAILRHLGQPASHVIGHKEWAGAAQGKWDPGGMDMNEFRADVQAIIDLGPGGNDVTDEQAKQLQRIEDQLGPGLPGWPPLGVNDKGEPLTLRDAVGKALTQQQKILDWQAKHS